MADRGVSGPWGRLHYEALCHRCQPYRFRVGNLTFRVPFCVFFIEKNRIIIQFFLLLVRKATSVSAVIVN